MNLFHSIGMLVSFVRSAGDSRTWFWMGVVNGTLSAAGGLASLSDRPAIQATLTCRLVCPCVTGLLFNSLAFPLAQAHAV